MCTLIWVTPRPSASVLCAELLSVGSVVSASVVCAQTITVFSFMCLWRRAALSNCVRETSGVVLHGWTYTCTLLVHVCKIPVLCCVVLCCAVLCCAVLFAVLQTFPSVLHVECGTCGGVCRRVVGVHRQRR